jgi:TolB-like protein
MEHSDRLPRKLAAILYADVAGYSRLTGDDEDATHRTLSEYLDLISSSVESHHGRIMHYAGDAVLAMFNAVIDALACASAIQEDLKTRSEGSPEGRRLKFRIGLNLGDVIEDRGDIYGDGVNIAARLESLAEPGGICISGTVYDAIGNKLPIQYEFMGEQQVKNIEKPVRAYRVLQDTNEDMEAVSSGPLTLESPDKPSIAVLPFTNMSGDPEQEYFSDGITEDIITELSRFPTLFVIARHSSFAFRAQTFDVKEIGGKLGVRYIVEGSVRTAGDRMRITAQLIDVETGNHIWAASRTKDFWRPGGSIRRLSSLIRNSLKPFRDWRRRTICPRRWVGSRRTRGPTLWKPSSGPWRSIATTTGRGSHWVGRS